MITKPFPEESTHCYQQSSEMYDNEPCVDHSIIPHLSFSARMRKAQRAFGFAQSSIRASEMNCTHLDRHSDADEALTPMWFLWNVESA
jgi:hypothetical protein